MVDAERQQQTPDQNKRGRHHHIKQRELEGLQKFIVLRADRIRGVRRIRRRITGQPQYFSVVVKAHKRAVLNDLPCRIHLGTLGNHALCFERACLRDDG